MFISQNNFIALHSESVQTGRKSDSDHGVLLLRPMAVSSLVVVHCDLKTLDQDSPGFSRENDVVNCAPRYLCLEK